MIRKHWREAMPHVILFGVVALILLFIPFRFVFEFDPDEGIELIKGLLVSRGYVLFEQIYTDQPPLLALVLAGTISVFGPEVPIARAVILVFSILLVGSAVAYLQREWGRWHAISWVVAVFSLPYYLQLSLSVMPGLPAIALAMLSVAALAAWHRTMRFPFLLVSAIALGLSVMTKLLTAILLPLLGCGLLLEAILCVRGRRPRWSCAKNLVIWGVTVALTAACVLLSAGGRGEYGQLIGTHIDARQVPLFQAQSQTANLIFYTKDTWPLFVLALVGTFFAVRRRKWTTLYFVGWALLGTLLLANTVPTWYHHQLLVTVPAAVLAAVALPEAFAALGSRAVSVRQRWASWLGAAAVVILFGAFVLPGLRDFTHELDFDLPNIRDPREGEASPEQFVLKRIIDATEVGERIVTDRPMFAFRANLEIPPELATFSLKRLQTGDPTEQDLVALIEATKPRVVLLGRFVLPKVREALERSYSRVFRQDRLRLWIRAADAE